LNKLVSREKGIKKKNIEKDHYVKVLEKEIKDNKHEDSKVLIKEIRKVYITSERTKVAVEEVSFNIKRGECFTLLGVNGAGKTTTFKILCGEIKPTSGNVYLNGVSMVDNLTEARKYIGYCS